MRDSCNLNRDHERGRSSSGAAVFDGKSETIGVVRNDHAKEEHAEHIEEQYSVKGQFDRARNRLAWILSLAHSNSHQLGSQISEYGRDYQ